MFNSMWSLFVGNTEGVTDESEGEEEEEEARGKQENLNRTKMASSIRSSLANLKPLESTRIPSSAASTASSQDVPAAKLLHRIPSPTREQGDGMEATSPDEPQTAAIQAKPKVKINQQKSVTPPPVTSSNPKKKLDSARSASIPASLTPKTKMIILPQTNIRLDKLPPITADREVSLPSLYPSDGTPLVQMMPSLTNAGPSSTASPPFKSGFQANRTTASAKEPKFVPYEPYKAAVTSILPPNKHKKTRRKSAAAAIAVSASTSAKQSSVEKPEPSKEVKSTDENCLDNEKPSESVSMVAPTSEVAQKPLPSTAYDREDRLVTGLLDEANSKISVLEASLANAEKQLKIQTQVNAEVKKLLVASVGEDIEAKVDYLTQDKARLAADIRQYSNKICRDFEEKEKLSVESDLWKSKFLACSVIVDELARWKVNLLQRQDDVDHHVRLLLHERAILWDTLNSTADTLANIKAAFDPLGTQTPEGGQEEVASVLGLAELSQKMAGELKERLLSDKKGVQLEKEVKRSKIDTPAEGGLRDIVAHKVGGDGSGGSGAGDDYSTAASIAVTGAARPHLAKMNDKLSSPDVNSSHFKCCTHCKGAVVHTV